MMVELATVDDYDAICEVVAEVDRLHAENTPDVFSAKSGPARTAAWMHEMLRAPDRAVLVARDAGAVVGVLEIYIKPPREGDGYVPRAVAVVDGVSVREAHRGRGIGRALLEAARDWASAKGAAAMQLHVWSWNEGARRLYERMGYATRGLVMEAPVSRS